MIEAVSKIVQDGENQVAQPAPVTIGTRRAGYVEIVSGLSEKDLVVVEGTLKAMPGAPVKILETRSIEQQVEEAINYANPRKKDALKTLQKQGDLPSTEPKEPEGN